MTAGPQVVGAATRGQNGRARTVHVVVGPEEHGVVRHGLLVAAACGGEVVRLRGPDPVPAADVLGGADVVHVPFTDRLFADHAEDAVVAFRALVWPFLEAGVALSVTLHDLPAGDSALERRRRAAYGEVVGLASGVVVNSWRELELVDGLAARARSLRCIPLPVEPSVATSRPTRRPAREVVVLGFVFPDRGYEHTIDELPDGVDLRALGRPSAGHEDLPSVLAERAARGGHAMVTTGFVPDAELSAVLTAAAVPVAPNRRVAASGSINTWTTHGRRPLVPDSPYSRELELRSPGRVATYDADTPGALRRAVEEALADPDRTWLAPGTRVGPTLDEVAEDYARHLAACAPPTALRLGGDRWVVPGNRWDLLDGQEPAQPPTVTVVVPHHEAQPQLDLVLTALSLQTHPHTRLHVVVADDGSAVPPILTAATGLEVDLVRQERDGFRAAAARNLGAAAGDGQVVAFLDGDTVPEPDYVARLVRLPALLPDALVVGRRRHADLTGWTPRRLRGWFDGAAPGPEELPEPAWLRDAYAASGDLLEVDARSHRLVISAVMAMSRDLLTELRGFDERFRAYGGEDWELAHRAYAAGAVLAHVPGAVAWHDGPDFAGRAQDGRQVLEKKNRETLTLTALLPDPEARGGGSWRLPAVVVELAFTDPVEVLATSRAAFSGDADSGVWVVDDGRGDAGATVALLDDPRIRVGPAPTHVLDRARCVVRLDAPARLTGLEALVSLAERHGRVGLPTGTVTSRRTDRRSSRRAPELGWPADVLAGWLFGERDVPHPRPSRPVDLAHELKRVYASTRASTSRS